MSNYNTHYYSKSRQKWQEKQEKLKKQGLLSYQIRDFYRETIGGLRKTASLSRKGKPRKQQWGMHIIDANKGQR